MTAKFKIYNVNHNNYARSLIEASLDPLVTISPEGKITDVNEASVKVTGILRENLIDTDFSNYFTDPKKAQQGYLRVFEKGFVSDYPLTIKHKNGNLTDVLYNASVYKDDKGNVLGVFAAARDVTEQIWAIELRKVNTELAFQNEEKEKQAQELILVNKLERKQVLELAQQTKDLKQINKQVKDKEQQLSNQLNAINKSNAIIEFDLNGIILGLNENFSKMLGYSEKEIVGKHHSIFILKEYVASKEYYQFWENLKKGEFVQGEFKRIHKNGKTVWLQGSYNPILDASGQPFKILKIATDISLVRKQILELAQQTKEIEKRAEELNIANKELAFQNKEKEKRAAELVIANKELAFQNEEKEKRANELLIANKELTFQNKEKEKRAAELIIANKELAFQNEEKEKRAAELVIAKERAEESDRLKSAFFANMSHEIRTPMNGILGFAELLKGPGLTTEEQLEYVEIIEKSGKRMLNIINDIVDLSKIESGLMKMNIKDSNINEQIEYVYTFFKPEVEAKGMQLFFKNALPSSEAIITTDREKLFSILSNLIKNAIKYSNNGTIEMGYILKTKKESTIQSSNKELEFYVKDTGIGIPKDRQKAVFERFVQADIEDIHAKQGAGLGLSITKAYIKMLGGKIWLESEEGKGSTFYFTIPYNNKLEEIKVAKNLVIDNISAVPLKKIKILIAEDDQISKLFINKAVQPFGKEIINVDNGSDAVEACHNTKDIDLVLMDIKMPIMDGYEASQKIRQFNKEVVIIAQTAYGLNGDREKSLDAGFNDYIRKPVNKTELESLIQKYFCN